ncbi:MAG: urea ABC transporter substrate-binding protein [Isosphaeraceae bacterium]
MRGIRSSKDARRGLLVLVAAGIGFVGCSGEVKPIVVGILHSQSGTMAVSERAVIDATVLALEEVNAEGGVLGRPLRWVIADGASSERIFAQEAERLIRREKARVLFGCWTSASRKAVKEVVEREDHLLFYPVQYEGCEASRNVVYLGAAPNQQIIPAVSWALTTLGKRVFLVGSDYIFPRTANTIIRQQVEAVGGTVVGERYLALGETAVDSVVSAIHEARPDVVLNTVNGDTNVLLFESLARSTARHGKIPIISFSIGENELKGLADRSPFVGHYAAWNYFESLDRPRNREFLAAFRGKYGADRAISDPMEAAYCGVKLWAQAVRDASSDVLSEIRPTLFRQSLDAPEGDLALDPLTQHAWKVARIGRIRADGQFDVVWSSDRPVRPAPFPVWRTRSWWEGLVEGFHREWGGRWSNPGEPGPKVDAPSTEPSS